MAIGTVSEWVAGISQFLAVCVALFLPYYNQHKKLKRRTRNLRVIIKQLGKEALAGEKKAIPTLEIYLTVSFLEDTNADMERLLVQGRVILETLKQLPDQDTADYPAAAAHVKHLLAQVA
ncbi:hypothetical protein FC83_GL002775 [Agrilactobacillus composti DSM 18527 = JCM 14202]|uniref:Uncharacterized protein n=1 Tax=Agrilactobacillus composti DSM 18527 = JCM 14202 TaxID=1423734 RepID=X0PTW4_9LACO|nr:hypothetical protein [Agrilactobacillus composti]KRM33524.1 hypothetical protein FC83_GL002775 [Agrilactobacillus composti DSM 18527 = JCM 14202]GAF41472.1 hypothetical protein JCM14202_3414 [Agrilactobacillus composti DSM 18527 = JCM 14202]